MEESLKKLRQEYEDAKVKAAQYGNQVTRLQNRLNYKPESIPRTQDMKPYYIETTGLYVYRKSLIQNFHRRVGFKPYLLEVSETEALDIDTPADFEIVNAVYAYTQKCKR